MTPTLLKPSDLLGVTRLNQWLPLGHSPYPHQQYPEGDYWDLWLLLGGRGSGKTETGANHVLNHLREFKDKARVGIGAPTIADARDVCAEGATGLITLAGSEFRYNRSLGEAFHRDGGYVKLLGSEESGRWNGPQWSMLWWDELALCNEESWDQSQFGLRLGAHPRTIATTTPKNRRFVKALAAHPKTIVTRAKTFDNPNLSTVVLERLKEKYGGTRLGRQELDGDFVDDIDGALWQRQWIEDSRVTTCPELKRVVVAIDPAGTSGKKSDETGMTVAGVGLDRHYYVLHGMGYRLSPNGWATKALSLYDHYRADRLIAERNNGGEMVESTIRNVRQNAPLRTIHASRGKAVRAEPISALYEKGLVHHVGMLATLEDQMCSFTGIDGEPDDQVDSLVYAISELMKGNIETGGIIEVGKPSKWR